MKVWLAKPKFTEEDLAKIDNGINESLRSGWLTSGENVKLFEKQFAESIGSRLAVAVGSGSASLQSILLALGIGPGDEVIVPTKTFVGTVSPILWLGAKPVFVDSDPETLDIDPYKAYQAFTRKTRAVIAVHIGGNPCDMTKLLNDCSPIPVIEDAAHAHGATHAGKHCGTFGTASGFSFSPTKVITATEGGMVTTDRQDIAARITAIRNQGRGDGFGPKEVSQLGFTSRMSEALAVIGLSQLSHLEEFVQHRNKLAERYTRGLPSWLRPQKVREGDRCSYYAYCCVLKDDAPMERDALMKHLAEKGIETSILFKPLHLMPLFKGKEGEFPNAEVPSIALPMGNALTAEEVDYVIETLNGI